MNIPSFLDAVNACLKVETGQSAPPEPQPAPPQPQVARPETRSVPAPTLTQSETYASSAISNLTILLSGLRKDLGALAVLLLDENGRVLARSGSFPDSSFENRWPEALMETVRATIKVSKLLESPQPRSLVALQGMAFDLVISPVGSYALVLALRTGRPTLRLGLAFEEILNIQKNLLSLVPTQAAAEAASVIQPEAKLSPLPQQLSREPPPPAVPRTGPLAPKAAPFKTAPLVVQKVDEPISAEFAALFQEKAGLDTQDVEAFWDNAASVGTPVVPGSDAITYEQARKMGLAPGLDEEKP
jgi:hypothetical protein